MKSKLFGHGANDLFWFIFPLVLPTLLIKYDLNFTQAGGLLTIYLAVTAIFSFIVGKASDKLSRRKILSYGFYLSSAGLASSGFAPTLGVFLIFLSFTAVGVSTFHPVMYAVIDDNYSEKKGQVMGQFEGFGAGAVLIMFLINGFLINRIGVRGILILTAIPALIMGCVYQFTESIPERAVIHGKNEETSNRDRGAILHFSILLLSIIFRIISVTGVVNFLPVIFVNFLGYDPGTASYATAFFFAGGLMGTFFAGRLADRYNPINILILGTLLIIPSLFLFSMTIPGWMYLLSAGLLGCFGLACFINQNLLIGQMGGHLGKGEVFGILMGVMTLTSSLSPTLLGFMIDRAGFRHALIAFLFPLVLSLLLLLILKRVTGAKKNL
jgi:FSR family fosmidomycin resistance protein-like MFS transporter